MTPATRAQAEDAVRVLDAVMLRDSLEEQAGAAFGSDEWLDIIDRYRDARDRALHQMTMYAARYGHTR